MSESKEGRKSPDPARRRFLTSSSHAAMLLGLAGGYGAFGWIAARYLFLPPPQEKRWLFLAETASMKSGETLLYLTPDGATVNVTRKGTTGSSEDFVALSSTCPHLGCQVQWQAAQNRYFCPCHNGTFDAEGKGTGGPPGDAGQSLGRYTLKVESGLLFLEAPADSLRTPGKGEVLARNACPGGPGHDPCLSFTHRARFDGRDDRKA